MIQCIALDMDGTLVNSNLLIHDENAKAIKEAKKNGIEVVIATGRSYLEAINVLQSANIQCPLICVNGSEVRNSQGEIIEKVGLDLEIFKQIKSTLERSDMYYEVYTDRGTYTIDYDKALIVMMDIYLSTGDEDDYDQLLKGAKARFEKGLVTLIDDFDVLLNMEGLTIYKVLAFSFEKDKLARARKEVERIPELAVSSSGKENIEITSLSAQKGVALEKFTAEKNLSMNNTMAVGDNYNDVSMFEKVGYAVAMGNAPDDIKALCDDVTKKNDEHGVAEAINKVLRGEEKKRGV